MSHRLTCIITYVNNGYGFKGPAIALQKSLERAGVTVHCIDLLDFLGAHKVDHLWKDGGSQDLAKEWSNKLTYYGLTKIAWLGFELTYQVIRKSLASFIEEIEPDFILSTHFLTNSIIGKYLRRRHKKIPFYIYNAEVINFHKAYVDRSATKYLAPTQPGFNTVLKYIKDPRRILLTAFPLDDKFHKQFGSVAAERKKLGLKNTFTLLLSFGGEGIGAYTIIEELIRRDLPIQLVVACGRNEGAVEKIHDMAKDAKHIHVKAIGFTLNLQDYIYCSDISAGKSGMNTTFESIFLRKPFIVTKSLVNELVNVRLITEQGYGWEKREPDEFCDLIERLLADPTPLKETSQRMAEAPYRFSTDVNARALIIDTLAQKFLKDKQGLLFDLAGTLCDIPIGEIWEEVNVRGFADALAEIGYGERTSPEAAQAMAQRFVARKAVLRKAAKKDLREYEITRQFIDFFTVERKTDPVLDELLTELASGSKDSEDLPRPLLERLEEIFITPELQITIPFEGVNEMLEELSSRYTLHLLSNNVSRILVERILEMMDITKYFTKVFVSSELGWRKPHVNFIDPVLTQLGTNDVSCLCMIGDRLNQDIQMANEKGMTSIYISAAEHEDNDGVEIPFDIEVKDLSELHRLLTSV